MCLKILQDLLLQLTLCLGENYLKPQIRHLVETYFFCCICRQKIVYRMEGSLRPKSIQPVRLYATAKTHKLIDLDEITAEKLKFRPIVDQTGTVTYDAAKAIGEYLTPLALNEYKINDWIKFPDMIKALPSLQKDEEHVSYDVDSLFTNILLKETIDYIIHKIYSENVLKLICKKHIHIQAVTVQIGNIL